MFPKMFLHRYIDKGNSGPSELESLKIISSFGSWLLFEILFEKIDNEKYVAKLND